MTKKVGMMGITCTLLATFLFLSVGPSLVMALQTACFYSNRWHCLGSAACCVDLASDRCCENLYSPEYGKSASVSPPVPPNGEVRIYTDTSCQSQYASSYGHFCWNSEMSRTIMKSGKWKANSGQDGAAPAGSEKPCDETVSPDTLRYTFITEDRRRASWVLPMANLTETDSNGPPLDRPAEEQVIWFKSRGATLKVEDHQTTPVADYNASSPAAGLT